MERTRATPGASNLFERAVADEIAERLVDEARAGLGQAVRSLASGDARQYARAYAWVDSVALADEATRWVTLRQALAITSAGRAALGGAGPQEGDPRDAERIEAALALGALQRAGVRDALAAVAHYRQDASGEDNAADWVFYASADCPPARYAGFLLALVYANAWRMRWWASGSEFSAQELWAGLLAQA